MLKTAVLFLRGSSKRIPGVLLFAAAVGVVRRLWGRKRLEVILEVITLGHEIGHVLAVEEPHLDADNGANAKNEHDVDPAKLEGRLGGLVSTVGRLLLFLGRCAPM